MSWIIQTVFTNYNQIVSESRSNIESDVYSDLLLIDKATKDLYESGSITEEEMKLIDYVKSDGLFSDSSKTLKMDRNSFTKKFDIVCDRIAFYMGGYYTDDGYLHYMQNKYNLDNERIEELRKYMHSKFRHRLLSKPMSFNKETISE